MLLSFMLRQPNKCHGMRVLSVIFELIYKSFLKLIICVLVAPRADKSASTTHIFFCAVRQRNFKFQLRALDLIFRLLLL